MIVKGRILYDDESQAIFPILTLLLRDSKLAQ